MTHRKEMIKPDTKQTGDQALAIKKQLREGDVEVIAEATSYSVSYVRKVLSRYDKRNNQRVMFAAKKLIENRDQFIQNMQDIMKMFELETAVSK